MVRKNNSSAGVISTDQVQVRVGGNNKNSNNTRAVGGKKSAKAAASTEQVAAPAESVGFVASSVSGAAAINQLWDHLMAATTAEDRSAAASGLATGVKDMGAETIASVVAAFQLDNKGPARLSAMFAAKALVDVVGLTAEPFLMGVLPQMLDTVSSKVRDESVAATAAVTALLVGMSVHGLPMALPMLFAAMDGAKGWQTRVLAFNMLAAKAETTPLHVAERLPAIVPVLTEHVWDTKAQVKTAARECMSKCLTVVDNGDVAPVVPALVSAMINPTETVEFIHRVAATTFVRSVTSPTLAILVPTLVRGLNERATAVKRQTAKIIHNMSKLVDDPVEAAPFLPLLLPALLKASESVSNPEARAVCTEAHAQLERLDAKLAEVRDVPHSVEHSALVAMLSKVVVAPEAEEEKGAEAGRAVVNAGHLDYAAWMCGSLIEMKDFENDSWVAAVAPLLALTLPTATAAATVSQVLVECLAILCVAEEVEEDDDAEELCNCQFTLAYGSKVLLHNTHMRLKRGYRYGLLGANDSGKTTLMRSIANGQVEGFPPATEVRTVFVEADIQGEQSHLTCINYVLADEAIRNCGASEEEVGRVLGTVGFTDKMQNDAVTTLSGGWRMKLALARAMLQNADILLLDEPTNHLDVINVAWVKNYLNSLTHVTSIIVSHDSGLLDDVCSHILQIDSLKLKTHKGNLSSFVEKVPSARSYFELSASRLSFRFPQPGALQGVKSKGRALMKMEGVEFTYPINDKPTLTNITVQVSLSSRVACVGVNGAGKSTMIKLLTGELEPCQGTVWKHPNARVAYVAQHAFHHIEKHLTKTPNEYIRWRYANDEDKESLNKVTLVVTEAELELQRTEIEWVIKDEDTGKTTKSKRVVDQPTGARRETRQKTNEYEVKFKNMDLIHNDFISERRLVELGFAKQLRLIDAKIAARAGMYVRPLTSNNVEAHLEDVGLDREFGTHHRMSALSGGQKVKVVLAAAMWNQPHILILDEPTNYLDRESLGALAGAIREFEGGVVMITHNNEFCSALCPETWVLENGSLDCQGDPEWMANAANQEVDFKVMEEMVDAAGNKVAVSQKKELTRKEKKLRAKRRKEKLKAGEDLNTSDESTIG